MLSLLTLEGRMFVIEHDVITALEEAEDHTMVWCGNQLHRVKEDFETVWDMWREHQIGLEEYETEPPEGTLGMVHPGLLHRDMVDQGADPDSANEHIMDLMQRSYHLGKPGFDDNGRPVITPAVEPVPK